MFFDKSKQCTTDILIPHERAITLAFSDTNSVGGRHLVPSEISTQSDPPPFKTCRLQQISTYNVSTIRDNENSITTNRKSDHGLSNQL